MGNILSMGKECDCDCKSKCKDYSDFDSTNDVRTDEPISTSDRIYNNQDYRLLMIENGDEIMKSNLYEYSLQNYAYIPNNKD